MVILFMEWNSIGNADVLDAFAELSAQGNNISVSTCAFDQHRERDDKEYIAELKGKIDEVSPDFVMSFNYWPAISEACNQLGIKYAAWVYDNPSLNLFSYTLINPCNYVFLFDSQVYEFFATRGIQTVHYLPLAAAVNRYDSIIVTDSDYQKWGGEISFVGSLYTGKHDYYEQIKNQLSDYTKGYIEGLMRSQMEVYGKDIIETALTPDIISEMEKELSAHPSYDGTESYEYLYGNYVIKRKMTAVERTEILSMIADRHEINLFSDSEFSHDRISNRGRVDYYDQMPLVFKTTDINLNITLRSIERGIPLRAFDIMGCGGFLLSNYQEDLASYFTPGEDYVYYESREDLIEKIDYYLVHDEERRAIADSGHAKVRSEHKYTDRLEELIDIVIG